MNERAAVLALRLILPAVLASTLAVTARAQVEAQPEADPGAVPRGSTGAIPVKEKKAAAPKVSMPRLRRYSPPSYPEAAKKQGIQATVILTVSVDATGNVSAATVHRGAGRGFDQAAVEASKGLLFEPARKPNGTAVAAKILFRYRFTLTEVKRKKAPTPAEVPAPDAPPDAEDAPPSVTEAGVLDVTVRGDKPPRELTKRTLQREEIDRIPGTNGDALRSVQNLPGVARPPSFAGLLIVRGSAPQDTQTFIDGTPVPLIYHFGGLSSVVPTEVLERIDFYPGNFGVEYGRGMGGIVDVGLRSPTQDGKYHGLAQLDFIDGRLLFEGHIPYAEDWTFIAAGRRSWVDAFIGPALEAAGADVTQAPVYYDYQFMIENKVSDDARFRIRFLGSDDAFELLLAEPPESEPGLTGDFGLHTAFQRLQASYEERYEDRRVRTTFALGHDDLDFQFGPFYLLLDTYTLSTRLDLAQKLARFITLHFGGDLELGYAVVGLRIPPLPPAGQTPNQPFSTQAPQEISYERPFTRPAAYIDAEIMPLESLRIVPGFRVDYDVGSASLDLSPRINGRYDLRHDFPRTTVKGGVGLYYQPPQPFESVEPLGTPGLESNRAVHYGLGMEQEITRQLEAGVEGFVKQLDNLVVSTAPNHYENAGDGYAVGGEVLLKYKPDEYFFGWLAYTLSRSVRQNGPDKPEKLADFDQTHNLTLIGSVKLPRGMQIGLRFRVGSGNLITPNVCDPEQEGCDPLRVNSIYHAGSGTYVPIPYGDGYRERSPVFHQLDLRFDKRWTFTYWKLSLYIDIQNVYVSENVQGLTYNFNYTQREGIQGLPILPSFGLRGEF